MVSSGFLGVNKYELSEIKVKLIYEVVQARQEETFKVSKQEKDNLDDVTLRYKPFCKEDESASL